MKTTRYTYRDPSIIHAFSDRENERGGKGTESVVMEKAQGGAKKKQGGGGGFRAARKDVCKNMSTEEFERFTQEKKISDWVEPKSIYDKETRRREKTATRLSMLRSVPITIRVF